MTTYEIKFELENQISVLKKAQECAYNSGDFGNGAKISEQIIKILIILSEI